MQPFRIQCGAHAGIGFHALAECGQVIEALRPVGRGREFRTDEIVLMDDAVSG